MLDSEFSCLSALQVNTGSEAIEDGILGKKIRSKNLVIIYDSFKNIETSEFLMMFRSEFQD